MDISRVKIACGKDTTGLVYRSSFCIIERRLLLEEAVRILKVIRTQ